MCDEPVSLVERASSRMAVAGVSTGTTVGSVGDGPANGSSPSSSLLVSTRLVRRETAPVAHHTHPQEERDTKQDNGSQPQEGAQGIEDGHGPTQAQQQNHDFIADGTAHGKEREQHSSKRSPSPRQGTFSRRYFWGWHGVQRH